MLGNHLDISLKNKTWSPIPKILMWKSREMSQGYVNIQGKFHVSLIGECLDKYKFSYLMFIGLI